VSRIRIFRYRQSVAADLIGEVHQRGLLAPLKSAVVGKRTSDILIVGLMSLPIADEDIFALII
jgi:hypothetical protein